MSKLKNILWTAIVVLFTVPVAALVFFSLPFSGWKALAVQTGSMVPKYPIGTVVLVHKTSTSTLKVGDVITYKSLDKPITITHRIIQINTVPGGFKQFITKGDANPGPDALPVSSRQVVGEVNYTLPAFGKFVDFVRTIPGLLLCVYLPAVLLAGYEIHVLAATLSRINLEEYKAELKKRHEAALARLRLKRQQLALQTKAVDSGIQPAEGHGPRPVGYIIALLVVCTAIFTGGVVHALTSQQAELTDISISGVSNSNKNCDSVIIENLHFPANDDENRPNILKVCAPSCARSILNTWVLKGDEGQVWHGYQLNINCHTKNPTKAPSQPPYWDLFTLFDGGGHQLATFRVHDDDDHPSVANSVRTSND